MSQKKIDPKSDQAQNDKKEESKPEDSNEEKLKNEIIDDATSQNQSEPNKKDEEGNSDQIQNEETDAKILDAVEKEKQPEESIEPNITIADVEIKANSVDFSKIFESLKQ